MALPRFRHRDAALLRAQRALLPIGICLGAGPPVRTTPATRTPYRATSYPTATRARHHPDRHRGRTHNPVHRAPCPAGRETPSPGRCPLRCVGCPSSGYASTSRRTPASVTSRRSSSMRTTTTPSRGPVRHHADGACPHPPPAPRRWRRHLHSSAVGNIPSH